ncbi:uncharacterized protein LOC125655755 isoform X2 [Ostrea edulis]|uniref:uncharacterized protein LOC125655755 isoform X2 n=1 Tax=Ostrea edulis TaxID=37623 RepID=UPI0024AF3A19|nr:uncharacterized protein LOC125655755 isoform X2 [Ostrea edulis]
MENTIKRQILYLCSWNFQTTRLLISIALLFGVCGYTWFEAQNECRLVGETLGLRPHTIEPFWTSLHKRRSLWMQNLGCYKYSDQDPALKDGDVFDMTHYASAGLCQELCMEQNKKFSFLFGIKDQNCFCFKYDILPLLNSCNSRCKGTCSSGNGSNCSKYRTYLSVGGQRNDRFPAAYPGCIVIQCIDYISYKVRRCESNFTTACEIQDSINQVYHSNPVNFVLKYKEVQNPSNYFGKDVEYFFQNTCKSMLNNNNQPVWIAFSRENYTRFDKGEMLSDVDKRNTMTCQLCKDGCRFGDCNFEVDEAECSETIVTKETSMKSTLKMTVTKPSFSKTDGFSKTPNETRETKGRETTENVSGLSHNYSDQTLSYILATTTSTNNVATSLVCLGLTVFCIRKRTSAKTERTERRKAPSTGKIKPIPTKDSKMDTLAELKTSAYALADNSRFEQNCANEKVDNSRFEECVYDVADNSKLKEESPYSEGGEGHYDHLRDTTSRRQVDEDTYNHIAPAGYATISEYDVMRKKENDQYRQSQFPTNNYAHAYSCVTLELYDKKWKYLKPQKRLE